MNTLLHERSRLPSSTLLEVWIPTKTPTPRPSWTRRADAGPPYFPDHRSRIPAVVGLAGRVRDTSSGRGSGHRRLRGRSVRAPGLPGMGTGDAMASTLSFVAAPKRMAVYDGRAHQGMALVGLELDNHRGRYARYMELVEQCRSELAARGHGWTAREVDLALFQLGERKRRTSTA